MPAPGLGCASISVMAGSTKNFFVNRGASGGLPKFLREILGLKVLMLDRGCSCACIFFKVRGLGLYGFGVYSVSIRTFLSLSRADGHEL